MSTFQPADVVKVHRPHKEYHGYFGRYLGTSPDPQLVYVAFQSPLKYSHLGPPDEKIFRNSNKATHKLLPLSNLQKVTT